MRLTLDALSVLDAIDRNGSFAAAAEELYRVPSAITYVVQKLEQDLDIQLFNRDGHRAALTTAGRELLQEGRHLLRAAGELESRVKRAASGWETELRIAISDLIPVANIYPLLAEFYQEEHGTRLRISREIYGGTWDALISGRADLVIGAPGEGPPGGGYATRLLCDMEFVFAVSPLHPLAKAHEPLRSQDILRYRAISAADSSRNLPPRTSGLLAGQDVLTLPDINTKLEAHRRGLGVGYLPKQLVLNDVAEGRLVIKDVEETTPMIQKSLAWRTQHEGKALHWFLKRLEDRSTIETLVNG